LKFYFSTPATASLYIHVNSPTHPIVNDATSESSSQEILSHIQVTHGEVLRSINELDESKACGHDNIPATFYKMCALEITPIFTKLINEMFKKGEFPEALKTALIHPLYKQKGEKNLPKNYRPISILSAAAKIIEKIMYSRVSAHLEQTDNYMKEQHGYRKFRSTQSAVIMLTDAIKSAADNGLMTGVVFVDFEKAFDSLQYTTFLAKLKKCGVSGSVLNWFKSYFENRKIIVKKGETKSDPFNLTQGTPQGSALSGMTFSIYLNDIKERLANSRCEFILYADDKGLFTHGSTPEEIESKLQLAVNEDQCR